MIRQIVQRMNICRSLFSTLTGNRRTPGRSGYVGTTIHGMLWTAVYSPVMKLAADFLVSSTAQLTALLNRAVTDVQARLSSFSADRTTSACPYRCRWQRVTRDGWTDQALSCAGWYPWQCQQCLKCAYFRRRR